VDLGDWLRALILAFRVERAKRLKSGPGFIEPAYDLRAPCQVDAIWVENRERDFDLQVLVFTHWTDIDDLTVNVRGPLGTDAITDSLVQMLAEEKWSRQLGGPIAYVAPGGEPPTCAKILENTLGNVVSGFKRHVLSSVLSPSRKLSKPVAGMTLLDMDCSYGRLQEMDVDSVVASIIAEAFKDQAGTPTTRSRAIPMEVRGYGAYFDPPIWIGEVPQLSRRERISGTADTYFTPKILDTSYRGRAVILNRDGFIAVVDDSSDHALEMLNEIMSVALLLRIDASHVSPGDLCELQVDPVRKEVHSKSYFRESARSRLVETGLSSAASSPVTKGNAYQSRRSSTSWTKPRSCLGTRMSWLS